MESDSDNDLNNRNLNEIKALVINFPLSLSATLNNENFEAFFNSLGFVKKIDKMAIIFTNKSFSYFLSIISKIFPNATCNTIDLNFFAYIAID